MSCIMMSENLTNLDRSRHVDVEVQYLRDLIRDGHVKLFKCAGTPNVSDALTKSLARRALRQRVRNMLLRNTGNICGELSPFHLSLVLSKILKIAPVVAYSIKLPKFISSSNFSRKTKCAGG